MKVSLQSKRKPRIEMIPLIDLMFLILVSFVYGVFFMSVHRGVPVALPLSSTAKIEKQHTLTLSIQAGGTVFLDKEPVTLESLAETLKLKATENKETGVLLFADRDLPYQKLYTVLDLIRAAGLSQVSLQA
ncbi:MAG: biopolymer transporter ExbD, partial [Deltaproteobacteria bacterium]|nr:biopolymer transporter ExbD [Deltaproteobacteria bacterium]